jgi:hypothetical protein
MVGLMDGRRRRGKVVTVLVRGSSTCDGPWMAGGKGAGAGPAQPKEEAPDQRRGRLQRD